MKKTYKSNLSTVKNIVLSIIFIVCFALDCWGLYIRFWSKDKVSSYIFKVGTQTASAINPTTGEITTEDRWFCEVNIYDNCYEILFNYFTDNSKSEFYSQGLQFQLTNQSTDLYSALNQNYTYKNEELKLYYKNQKSIKKNTETKTLEEVTGIFTDHVWYGRYETNTYYNNIMSGKYYNGITVSNFASANKYEDSIVSPNPLDENSYFYLDMGDDEAYLMQMKGSDEKYLKENSKYFFLTDTRVLVNTTSKNNAATDKKTEYYDNISYYRTCDVYYLAEVIFNSCKNLDYSSTGVVIDFEFGDLFHYYNVDEVEIINDQQINNKIKNYIASYYQIKVEKHQGNMTKASQSLFNSFNGSTNYNEESAEDSESAEIFTDYHHGRSILDIDENFFKVNLILNNNTGNYRMYLSLDSKFISKYPASNGYRLRVIINLDNLNFSNIEFAGLVNGTLNNYYVYQVLTTQTIDGEIITTDITQGVV